MEKINESFYHIDLESSNDIVSLNIVWLYSDKFDENSKCYMNWRKLYFIVTKG